MARKENRARDRKCCVSMAICCGSVPIMYYPIQVRPTIRRWVLSLNRIVTYFTELFDHDVNARNRSRNCEMGFGNIFIFQGLVGSAFRIMRNSVREDSRTYFQAQIWMRSDPWPGLRFETFMQHIWRDYDTDWWSIVHDQGSEFWWV